MLSEARGELDFREGILCPVCKKDLGEISRLQQHFAEQHEGPESKDQSKIRDFFSRAKSAFTNIIPSESQEFDTAHQEFYHEEQEIGIIRSRFDTFLSMRDEKIDQNAVETNKLIIRLDKLITQCPSDPSKRKAFEREVVPWIDDQQVTFCLYCRTRFTLTRRKHHCRLCGQIMCKECSQYITFLLARKLTNPASIEVEDPRASSMKVSVRSVKSKRTNRPRSLSPIKQRATKIIADTLNILKNDGSEVSVGSFFNQEGEDHLRVCPGCKELLERRDQMMEQRAQPPVFVQIYSRLRSLIEECSRIYPSYCRMAESLSAGESLYNLESAKDLKLKVLKLQMQIDDLSKKIAQYGTEQQSNSSNESQRGPSHRQLLLQKNIRQFAANFLQQMIMFFPSVPGPEEYKKLQEVYRERIRLEIERERVEARALTQMESSGQAFNPSRDHNQQQQTKARMVDTWKSTSGDGWTPEPSTTVPIFNYNPFEEDEQIDPLKQQILLIRGYLKQAAHSGRLDEVEMLEKNLKELESELKLKET